MKTRDWVFEVFALCTLFSSLIAAEGAPEPRVTTINFFGCRAVPISELVPKVGIVEGEVFDRKKGDEAVQRLKAIPGVETATFAPIRTSRGEMHLFFGILEKGARTFDLSPSPEGPACLPPELTGIYDKAMEALGLAIKAGNGREDTSAGHSLGLDPVVRKIQEAAIAAAAQHEDLFRAALRSSSESKERAAAAWFLGYVPDKRTVTADLAHAARDPHSGVRNNATRSLGAILQLAAAKPELGINVDGEVYVDMLNSVTWTDRNKASFVLDGLTKVKNPALLQALRDRAMPSLIEMAHWKSEGHALTAGFILGRMAGWTDQQTIQAMKTGRQTELVAAAHASAKSRAEPST